MNIRESKWYFEDVSVNMIEIDFFPFQLGKEEKNKMRK